MRHIKDLFLVKNKLFFICYVSKVGGLNYAEEMLKNLPESYCISQPKVASALW